MFIYLAVERQSQLQGEQERVCGVSFKPRFIPKCPKHLRLGWPKPGTQNVKRVSEAGSMVLGP